MSSEDRERESSGTLRTGRARSWRPALSAPRNIAMLVVAGLVVVAGALVAVRATRTSGPSATPAMFRNPVFQPDLPDPSIIQDRATGVWYAFGTTDYWSSSSTSLHIMPILSSRNLVNWTFVRNTFSPPLAVPAPGSPTQPEWTTGNVFLWSPEVHYIDGRYVMYYAASETKAGGSAIGVATASSPAGPWRDYGGPLVGPIRNSTGEYDSVIDPHEQRTPRGQRYLYYGSFVGGIHVVPLTANGLKVQAGASPVKVASSGLFEGTYVIYHDGYYYLFASSGDCCDGPNTGYEVVDGRSHSPLGPFVDKLGVLSL